MKTYLVYTGITESLQYTFNAKSLKDLRTILGNTWSSYKGRWYKQPVDGLPKGSKRFIIKSVHRCRSFVLIIPERKSQ